MGKVNLLCFYQNYVHVGLLFSTKLCHALFMPSVIFTLSDIRRLDCVIHSFCIQKAKTLPTQTTCSGGAPFYGQTKMLHHTSGILLHCLDLEAQLWAGQQYCDIAGARPICPCVRTACCVLVYALVGPNRIFRFRLIAHYTSSLFSVFLIWLTNECFLFSCF